MLGVPFEVVLMHLYCWFSTVGIIDWFALAFLLYFGVTLGIHDVCFVLHVQPSHKLRRYFDYNSMVFHIKAITVLIKDLITSFYTL